jgi:hypothetical protein
LLQNYLIDINNVKYKEAEVILPQIHKTIMNPNNASMDEILTQGVKFFEKQISTDIEPIKDAFATISTSNYKFGLIDINKNQIKKADNDSEKAEYEDVTYLFNTVKDRNGDVFVVDIKGNKLF